MMAESSKSFRLCELSSRKKKVNFQYTLIAVFVFNCCENKHNLCVSGHADFQTSSEKFF